MRKSLMLIAIMLASFVLAPGNALAEVSVGQGNADCAAWGGITRWNPINSACPWCNTTCFGCAGRNSQCFYIICDLKACDEIIFSKRPNKPPRILLTR